MIWLKLLSNFINAFRAGDSPGQIAGGFSVGLLIGIMPFFTLQGFFLFILLMLLNINMAAGTLAILLASLFAYLADPIFHSLGYFVLTGIPFLQGLWETLNNLPVAPLSRFNNTVVMGSFICGLALFIPVFYGMKKLVQAYRSGLEERINKWKIVHIIKGSKVVKLYLAIRDVRGE